MSKQPEAKAAPSEPIIKFQVCFGGIKRTEVLRETELSVFLPSGISSRSGERCAQKNGNHGHARRNEWPAEPCVGRVANGVASRVDRLKALGNGQVPRVAAAAFNLLSGRLAATTKDSA